jgi:lysophospholipase L1-like esterase
MLRRALLSLVVGIFGFLSLIPVANAHAQSTTYYLALGDSLAWGWQPVPADDGLGYAQDLYRHMLHTQPNLQIQNLSCVGETSATMLGLNNIYCPNWQFTKNMTTTPQMTQALSFIQAHPQQINLVTVDIGANDLLAALKGGITLQKLLQVILQLHTNLDSIFGQLRAAVGTQVPIATMTYYNPLIVLSSSPLITVGAEIFNGVISSEAAKFNVVVAPVYTAFNSGTIAQQRHNICTLTGSVTPHIPRTRIAGRAAT